MNVPRGRGRILNIDGRAVVVARCPLCHAEHRYAKGEASGEEIDQIRVQGFTDEWMPCQMDLPGNFWRVVISTGGRGGRTGGRPARATTAA